MIDDKPAQPQAQPDVNAAVAAQIQGLETSRRILGNIRQLFTKCSFPGEMVEQLHEAKAYVSYLSTQGEHALSALRKSQAEASKAAKKAKKGAKNA